MTFDANYLSNKRWDEESFLNCNESMQRYYDAEFEFIKNYRINTVLDIGYGNGSFLAWCDKQGIEVSGIEINSELLRRAKHRGIDVYVNLDEISDGRKFDLITGLDVLEHLTIDEIESLLIRAKNLLNDNGIIFITVPNGGSPFGRYVQHGDYTHKTTIGEAMIRQIAIDVDLRITDVRDAKFPVRIGTMRNSMNRFASKILRYLLEKSISLIYFGTLSRPLSPVMAVMFEKIR